MVTGRGLITCYWLGNNKSSISLQFKTWLIEASARIKMQTWMKLWKLCACICVYGSTLHSMAKRIKCFWGDWVTLHMGYIVSFRNKNFEGFHVTESTASTSSSCLQSLPSPAFLSVQCSMAKHCWKGVHICTAKLHPHNFTGSPERPATRWEFLNLTADSVTLLTGAKWLGTSGKVLDS